MTRGGSQRRRHHASARSHDATIQMAHPSGCHARHTSSAITPPWGKLSMLPPGMTGPRPQAEQRTRPQTSAAPQETGPPWRRAPTPLERLPANHWGPPRPGGAGFRTKHAWKVTPTTPATTQNRRRPKTWACGSTGSPQGNSSPWRSASDGCLLRGPANSVREPCTRADIIFGHRPGEHAPRHHGPPRPMALCGHPAHGAYGGLQPGRNEQTTLAMAPAHSPANPCGHAKAQHLEHPWIPGLPRARLRPPAAAVPRRPGAPQAGGAP